MVDLSIFLIYMIFHMFIYSKNLVFQNLYSVSPHYRDMQIQ